MSDWKRLTPKTARAVFDAILKMSKDDQKAICEEFDAGLDELAEQDCFGTEQQCDPRGDKRS